METETSAVDQDLIKRAEVLKGFKDSEAGKVVLGFIKQEQEALIDLLLGNTLKGAQPASVRGEIRALRKLTDFVESTVRWGEQEANKAEKIAAHNPQ